MDPTLSGFALGLLFGAAKVGLIGTVGFGIAWWRARKRLQQFESRLPDPALIDERLASLEQGADYSAAKLDQLIEAQDSIARLLGNSDSRRQQSDRLRPGTAEPITPH